MIEREDFVIVIGASAGGMNAIIKVIAPLKANINAAIFVIIHISQKGSNELVLHRLQSNTALPCHVAEDNMPIEKGHLYLAGANYHLIIKKDKLVLGHGPAEGMWRPSIDVAMRSAAAEWDGHTIGIILTGMLDDGTSGMSAIKRSGGVCIVQDPYDAEYPDMPSSVMKSVEVDYCVAPADIPAIIEKCLQNKNTKNIDVPQDVQIEAHLAEKAAIDIEKLEQLGKHSHYTCPDCGGSLWQLKHDSLERYRCFTGHAYTEKDLLLQQAKGIEGTLWVALRMMEERRNLLIKMADNEKNRGMSYLFANHSQRAKDINAHIDRLKEILFSEQKENSLTAN